MGSIFARAIRATIIAVIVIATPLATLGQEWLARPVYRSPLAVAFSPDGRTLAVTDPTAGAVVLIDPSTGNITHEMSLPDEPSGLAWAADGRSCYVAQRSAGSVAEIDLSGKIVQHLDVARRPMGVALAPQRGLLLTANGATDTASIVDLAEGRETTRVKVARMPYFLAVTPDETMAVVGNRIPAGPSTDSRTTAVVSLIDLKSSPPKRLTDIRLPPNSVNVHGVAISPDGHWAYLAHNVGRAALPTEQIEYGWISANALSLVDLRQRKLYATILLDQPNEGAANPWGVAVSPDGATLWVTLSGIHRLGRLDLGGLHDFLRPRQPLIEKARRDMVQDGSEMQIDPTTLGYSDVSKTTAAGRNRIEVVVTDLPLQYGQGLYLNDVFVQSDLPGNGPRGLCISPDGRTLAVAVYFTGTVLLVDTSTSEVQATVTLPNQPPPDEARRGERIFHDATFCFEHWLSCVTCHPDGRADGLNWDLLNDGIGNPKNTRSLLLAHRTPPAMSRGVRPDMESAVQAGFQFILFNKSTPENHEAVAAYLRSMQPAISPYRIEDRLSPKAERGRALFERSRQGCSVCHT
ncbi:MAG TPA: hypothetical protein VE890_11570, partial [Thermoguttaceae bacterium]|nr:hypothetical protein [Thermoguttaceae bacterium]